MNQNRRRKNKERMTITEQLSKIADEVCEDYCRYHDEAYKKFKDPDEAMDYIGDTYCVNCPLYKNI